MAYDLVNAASPQILLGQIATFMEANGWTMVDDMGDHDKVLFSSGKFDDQHLYVRLSLPKFFLGYDGQTGNFAVGEVVTGGTSGATGVVVDDDDAGVAGTLTLVTVDGSFLNNETLTGDGVGAAVVNGRVLFEVMADPGCFENNVNSSWVNTRSYTYWDDALHTGVNEVGRVGSVSLVGASTTDPYRMEFVDFTNPLRGGKKKKFVDGTEIYEDNIDASPDLNRGSLHYNEYGCLAGPSGGGDRNESLPVAVPAIRRFANLPLGSLSNGRDVERTQTSNSAHLGSVTFLDPITEKLKYFVSASNSAVPAQFFEIIDVETGVTSGVPAPVTSGSRSGNGSSIVWDGDDAIYVNVATSALSFLRYNISTASWTPLANLPVTTNTSQAPCYAPIYVPGGTIPGQPNDEIWFNLHTTVGTAIRRYDVGTNTWSSLSAAVALAVVTGFTWDRKRYVMMRTAITNDYYYIMDLFDIAAGWTAATFEETGTGNRFISHNMDHVAGRIRTSNKFGTQAHLIGDADHILVVSVVNGSTTWAGFGRFDSYHGSASTSLTAAANPGDLLSVTSSTGFIAGEKVIVVDRTTGAVHPTVVTEVPSSTTLSVFIPEAVSADSFITNGGANCIHYSDCQMAVCQLREDGYEPDGRPSLTYLREDVRMLDVRLSRNNISGRINLRPFELFWPVDDHMRGYRGRLTHVFHVSGVDSGTIITLTNGDQYLVVNNSVMGGMNDANHVVAVGPIN